MWDTLCAPSVEQAREYYAAGWWRDRTFLDDVAAHAGNRPDHPAIIGYEAGVLARTLTYAELDVTVGNFADALTELGVGRGDVVVLYLPNRWMLIPLYLACGRIGAISSPVIPALGGRELAHVLTMSQAKVCITVDTFRDVDYAQRLAEVAPESLRHRVVVGDAARTGAIDFADFFERTPRDQHRRGDAPTPLGPDEPALLLYTSGTTGEMKGVVHSQNTLYAASRSIAESHRLTADDVVSIPNYLTHMAGTTLGGYLPILLGGTCVMQDTNTDMALLLDLVQAHGITWVYASPSYLVDLLSAQREMPRQTGSLRYIVSGSAPVQPGLVASVREVFGVSLLTLWGMTENGAVTVTRSDDPPGWGAHSDGRPVPWMRIHIDVKPGDEAGRLLVKGASQCLGYLGQRDHYESCLDADGWFDTGDMARDDGRGGIRITGRRVDLITRASGQKIPTLEVEAVLQRCPAVAEVVLVGYPDQKVPGADLVCAIVVPDGDPPTLRDLHDYLQGEQMASVLWPDRLQFVCFLPKNALGKVLRRPLAQRLEIAQSAPR